MACGSCGGRRAARTVTAADGQQRPKSARTVSQLWVWMPFDKSLESKTFPTFGEAQAYVKEGNRGTVTSQQVG